MELFEGVANNREENPMTTSLTLDTNELRKISELPTEPALQHAATFLPGERPRLLRVTDPSLTR